MAKKLQLARSIEHLGILRILEMYKSKPGILIFNYHRIGDPACTRFDRQLFSATTDELDTQLKYLKKHFEIVSGDQLEYLVSGKAKLKRMHIALTFDDGYLDNYTHAFPILLANQCTASFFLITQYVGSALIPWWDEIAYRCRNSKKKQITLRLPVPITIKLDQNRETAIRTALQHFKRPDNRESAALLAELQQEADCELPKVGRRFLDWNEAREMRDAGMSIGSHTLTHPILGQITPETQQWELEHSKRVIEENLGSKICSLAYPIGMRGGFDAATEQIARSVGYTMCFSFYGGVNTPSNMNATNLLRGNASAYPEIFRTETMMLTRLGKALG
jgi:peptidoglycan/xylan/chitin deacetylase (PgdA/CDA1 family)